MDFALVGGGAMNIGLVRAMEDLIGSEIFVPKDPRITAALGAAIFAGEISKA
jgi:activator of 2-hydroxyglutaryl-CoA dehydratase